MKGHEVSADGRMKRVAIRTRGVLTNDLVIIDEAMLNRVKTLMYVKGARIWKSDRTIDPGQL